MDNGFKARDKAMAFKFMEIIFMKEDGGTVRNMVQVE